MAREVKVATVMNPLELLPAEGEAVLHVDGALGVVGQLVGGMFTHAQSLWRNAVRLVPLESSWQPFFECCGGSLVWAHEHLQLHLLKLAHAEDEVSWADLVAERLADLGDAERDLLSRRITHVLVLHVGALRRLGAEIDHRGILFNRAHEGLEHQIESARSCQRALAVRALQAHLGNDLGVGKLRGGEVTRSWEFVKSIPSLAGGALNKWIAEGADVARGLPHLRVHQDAGVESDDFMALLHHAAPPCALHIVLQFNAERAVIPHRVDAAVDFGAGVDKSAALRQRDDGVELGDCGGRVSRWGSSEGLRGVGVDAHCEEAYPIREIAYFASLFGAEAGVLDGASEEPEPPLRRSSLAQPLPLKCTLAAENCRSSDPPHSSWVRACCSSMPCSTSTVAPHFAQR